MPPSPSGRAEPDAQVEARVEALGAARRLPLAPVDPPVGRAEPDGGRVGEPPGDAQDGLRIRIAQPHGEQPYRRAYVERPIAPAGLHRAPSIS